MATAPHIRIHEIFNDRPSEERERLFSPDQFYAVATAMSYVEDVICEQDDPKVQPVIEWYRKFKNREPKGEFEVFEWYCVTSSECAVLAGQDSWKANANDFEKNVRKLMAFAFPSDLTVDRRSGTLLFILFTLFEQLIELAAEDLDKPPTVLRRMLGIFMRPLARLIHGPPPACYKRFTKEIADQARERLTRFTSFCEAAHDENRRFCFDSPDDQTETSLQMGDVTISLNKEGKVTFEG